jgi:hypothetical protein
MKDYAAKAEILINHYKVCKVCKQPIGLNNFSYHHLLHNTTGNRKNYPHFINSLSNGLPIHTECIGKDNQFRKRQYEPFLYEQFFEAFVKLIRECPVEYMLLFQDLRLIAEDEMRRPKNAKVRS